MMKNKKILLVTLLISTPFCILFGQESEVKDKRQFGTRIFSEIGIGLLPRQNSESTLIPNFNLGVEVVNRFSAYYVSEGLLALNKNDGDKYYHSKSMGGGLAYRIFEFGEKDENTGTISDAVDLRTFVTAAYGSSKRKYTSYNVMLVCYYYRGRARASGKICLGLGYRFMESHTYGVKNTNNFYATIGIRLF